MKVKSLGANQTEIVKSNGDTVFVSYETPVAACLDGTFYRTEKKWSVTTSKHITQWLESRKAEEKPQEFFNGLM